MIPSPSIADALNLHQLGKLTEAAQLYSQILSVNPDNPHALHLLGALRLQEGAFEKAIELIEKALEITYDNPAVHCNFATAKLELGHIDEAIKHYNIALSLDANYLDALYNLGNVLRDKGSYAEAATYYRRCFNMQPQHLPAFNNYAICLLEIDRKSEAVVILERALKIGPEDRQTRRNLGLALQMSGRPDDAAEQYKIILMRDPNDTAALNAYAASLITALRLEEAEEVVAKARKIAPGDFETLINSGNLHQFQKRYSEAEATYRKTIELFQNSAGAQQNLAQLHAAQGNHEEALMAFDRALEHEPTHRRAAFGRASSALSTGRFAEGWRDYRMRPNILARRDKLFCDKLPSNLENTHVVVERDQGLGDEIFFLRFLAQLSRRGPNITYVPDSRLEDMLKRADIADRIASDESKIGSRDFLISVSDLPYVLDMKDEDPIPPPIPLAPVNDLLTKFSTVLNNFGPGPYIGVTWRSGTKGLYGSIFKEIPLSDFAKTIKKIPGTVIALQRLPKSTEIVQLEDYLGRPILDLTELNSDLEAMLALVSLLDEYVCVSNTNVHLRTSCGKRCHVLVPHPAEFRWMAEGNESPWFKNSRIYRQGMDGDWSGALSQLAKALGS